jgi:hypothetical protein
MPAPGTWRAQRTSLGPRFTRPSFIVLHVNPFRFLKAATEPITIHSIGGQRMQTTHTASVKIIANDLGNPPGKLADAELHFNDGPVPSELLNP